MRAGYEGAPPRRSNDWERHKADKRRRKEILRKEGLGFMAGQEADVLCASCEMLKMQLKQAKMRILELEIMLNLGK